MAKANEEEKLYQLGRSVLREHDLETHVTYKNEDFILRHPAPWEKAVIEADIARRLGGFSRESFPQEHINMIEATAYVHYIAVYDKCPDWFSNAWICYDQELITALYTGYLQFRNKFSEKLRRGGFEGGGETGKS